MNYILIILVCTLLLLIIKAVKDQLSYFSKRSIPTPPVSSIIFGHLSDLWSAESYSRKLYDWTLRFGPIYGIYEGIRPLYVISDIKLIREIYVTQFSKFYARRTTLLSRILGKRRCNVLSTNIAYVWKKQRKILNPTYSEAKLKRLLPKVRLCVNILIENLASIKNDTIFNIYDLYKRLTMDVICLCAFGIETKVQSDMNNPNNLYMAKVEELFSDDFERTRLGKIHRILSQTCLANVCAWIYRIKENLQVTTTSLPPNLWLVGHMHAFIKQRYIDMKKNEAVDDLLQLMIDAIESEKNSFTPHELLSNVFIVLIAGYETTSTALAYCTYRLARHQDVQQKLYEELVESGSDDTDSYDEIISKLTYMNFFLREVLRMHPIAIQIVNRECMENTDVAGYHLEKGSLVQVDVLSVHFNQELWGPEPVDEFHPKRHSIKRDPLAFLPFGAGPRICIGMRFALMEIKLCLARLVSEYRILPSSNEKYELNINEKIVMTPENVFIKLEKR